MERGGILLCNGLILGLHSLGNCECRGVQLCNSVTPSAGYDRWEPAASVLGVACKDLHIEHIIQKQVVTTSGTKHQTQSLLLK